MTTIILSVLAGTGAILLGLELAASFDRVAAADAAYRKGGRA